MSQKNSNNSSGKVDDNYNNSTTQICLPQLSKALRRYTAVFND